MPFFHVDDTQVNPTRSNIDKHAVIPTLHVKKEFLALWILSLKQTSSLLVPVFPEHLSLCSVALNGREASRYVPKGKKQTVDRAALLDKCRCVPNVCERQMPRQRDRWGERCQACQPLRPFVLPSDIHHQPRRGGWWTRRWGRNSGSTARGGGRIEVGGVGWQRCRGWSVKMKKKRRWKGGGRWSRCSPHSCTVSYKPLSIILSLSSKAG